MTQTYQYGSDTGARQEIIFLYLSKQAKPTCNVTWKEWLSYIEPGAGRVIYITPKMAAGAKYILRCPSRSIDILVYFDSLAEWTLPVKERISATDKERIRDLLGDSLPTTISGPDMNNELIDR